MTEEEARAWLKDRFDVPRETWERLDAFVARLLEENQQQNLIAASTAEHVWARHIVDSAQLLLYAPRDASGEWLDLGSGPGLPGLVVAILSDWQVSLVESRRGRIAFLLEQIERLALTNAEVRGRRLEALGNGVPVSVISARAFAPLGRLLEKAVRFSDDRTIWLLPKGKNCQNELEQVRPAWQGVFHVEQSVTDPESAILVGRSVRKRGKR
ncbi:16S rRNA (guanine(527)-N(7))-methyltransferase RsmG [Rhizorhapis sp.]|uniref:16S rRNA (guanine(527)-N(7))-methyltransferase RsmG n=1 Tax=Rhizorhapis sp. TaxID=1968842 RepID=UPI002B4711C5|nr:16S rRNA (guanine(527)-N(7))-methyltransferase RsmG [Rhizorhapis sp.]HKR17537.1 16S rRNA (guanine(527)-N(7))-methyltransferase RsmG [Rhizorhapis sp.]